ncbi:MAG: M23 family metallopeptidase [Saprospiraceae bacterium]
MRIHYTYTTSCFSSYFRTILCCFLELYCLCAPLHGQQNSCLFISPVRHEIISSGSFGEPRSSHFHSGIDIKPYLGEGRDPLLAIGGGFISRIRMSPVGYGKALYIDHPCGYTSVYAHMNSFNPIIQEYIDKVRVATKLSEIDQYPPPFALPIKQGEVLGYLGNSGNSFGAHLHFEIRNTASETPINPVLFDIGPKDNVAPIIRGLLVYNLDHNRKVISQSYMSAIKKEGNNYVLNSSRITSNWPLVGFGIHVYDQSNGASNHNGIHYLDYLVNGERRFSFKIDSVSFEYSQYLHAHMDYGYKKNNKYVHKCFKDHGNPMSIYKMSRFGQILIPNEVIADHISIITADVFGNKSSLSFSIQKDTSDFDDLSYKLLFPNVFPKDTSVLKSGAFTITFLPHTFLHPELITLDSLQRGIKILSEGPLLPMFREYKVESSLIQLQIDHSDFEKMTFITKDSKGSNVNLGGQLSHTTIQTTTKEMGAIRLYKDATPPQISLVNNNRNTNITFRIWDNLKSSGKDTRMKYDGYADGRWVPMIYDKKNDLLSVQSKWIKGANEFKLKVSDFNKNISVRTLIVN